MDKGLMHVSRRWNCLGDIRLRREYIRFMTRRNFGSNHALEPNEINKILRNNEFTKEIQNNSVKSYDTNQLASNNPIEDMRSEALLHNNGILLGVFDGHAGAACAHVASKRLYEYVAAAMLPHEILRTYISSNYSNNLAHPLQECETAKETDPNSSTLKTIIDNHNGSFRKFVQELVDSSNKGQPPAEALETAILRLDEDLAREVLGPFSESGVVDKNSLSAALSGSVACITYVDGLDLHVANVGDSNAVIGVLNEQNIWLAKTVAKEHNAENRQEVERIISEHPSREKNNVIRRNRLLGELAPLRSLGDYRYKWPVDTLAKVVVPFVGLDGIPPDYYTPPYLTAKPDLYYHRITPNDKFIIIATDGLWDMLTPLQAVNLVAEHMEGKVFVSPSKIPRKHLLKLSENSDLVSKKKADKKPIDKNAATHLVRHAIGGTEFGIDDYRLSHFLTLPPEICRMFRDDITVTVAFFDSDFIKNSPT